MTGVNSPNIFEPDFDQARDHPGFCRRRAFLGRQAGCEKLGVSVWELAPGEAAYPYHFHYAEEEAVVVLDGALQLRTPHGWREVKRGELVAFPVGPSGAHTLVNTGEQPVRLLALSANSDTEVVVYPDSNKTAAYAHRGEPDEVREIFERENAVDYWHREAPPELPS